MTRKILDIKQPNVVSPSGTTSPHPQLSNISCVKWLVLILQCLERTFTGSLNTGDDSPEASVLVPGRDGGSITMGGAHAVAEPWPGCPLYADDIYASGGQGGRLDERRTPCYRAVTAMPDFHQQQLCAGRGGGSVSSNAHTLLPVCDQHARFAPMIVMRRERRVLQHRGARVY